MAGCFLERCRRVGGERRDEGLQRSQREADSVRNGTHIELVELGYYAVAECVYAGGSVLRAGTDGGEEFGALVCQGHEGFMNVFAFGASA